MYTDGASVSEIQRQTGVTNLSTFYTILGRNDVPVRLQRHRLADPTVKAEVIALRAEGFTYGEIAKKMGINRNYIGQALREDVKHSAQGTLARGGRCSAFYERSRNAREWFDRR